MWVRLPPAPPFRKRQTAGWSSLVARQAHNLKVVGSNPAPATNKKSGAASSPCRTVAQPGSAFAWGAKGHEFKSRPSDHFKSRFRPMFTGVSCDFAALDFGAKRATRSNEFQRGDMHPDMHIIRPCCRNASSVCLHRSRHCAYSAACAGTDVHVACVEAVGGGVGIHGRAVCV